MRRILDCSGAPRDLGLDEGRAFRSLLDTDLPRARRQLRPQSALASLRRSPVGPRAVAEAVLRHFPHHG